MNVNNVIIRPVLTEKSSLLREGKAKTYVFEVAKSTNKVEVMKAVKEIFSVEAVACNIVNVKGKKKANVPYKNSVVRGFGKTSSWKKAYVTLEVGKLIAELEA